MHNPSDIQSRPNRNQTKTESQPNINRLATESQPNINRTSVEAATIILPGNWYWYMLYYVRMHWPCFLNGVPCINRIAAE